MFYRYVKEPGQSVGVTEAVCVSCSAFVAKDWQEPEISELLFSASRGIARDDTSDCVFFFRPLPGLTVNGLSHQMDVHPGQATGLFPGRLTQR